MKINSLIKHLKKADHFMFKDRVRDLTFGIDGDGDMRQFLIGLLTGQLDRKFQINLREGHSDDAEDDLVVFRGEHRCNKSSSILLRPSVERCHHFINEVSDLLIGFSLHAI